MNKYHWISTKLILCIVEICFGIANGQISSFFELSAHNTIVVGIIFSLFGYKTFGEYL